MPSTSIRRGIAAATVTLALAGFGLVGPGAAAAGAATGRVVGYPAESPDEHAVAVAVPEGTLAITTPWTAANPLDLGTAMRGDDGSTWGASKAFGAAQGTGIQIIDRRAGAPSTTVVVSSSDFVSGSASFSAAHAGLGGLTVHAATGSLWLASDVVPSDVPANDPGLGAAPRTIAYSAEGHLTGTVWLSGTFELAGVASSVRPGTYVATLTLTAF